MSPITPEIILVQMLQILWTVWTFILCLIL